jgi:anti-sigma B factor antagonist
MTEVPSELASGQDRPPAEAPVELLHVALSRALPDTLVVRPAGEADLATAPLLHDAVMNAIEEHPSSVLVDLSGLSFCGSAGLAVLVQVRRAAADRGVGFAVVNPRPHVRQIIDVTGLRGYLALRETADQAL